MNKPERHHEVAIRIGADTWDDVISALMNITFELETKGPGRQMVSGGSSYGYIVIDKTNDDITNKIYFDRVDKWLKEQRKL